MSHARLVPIVGPGRIFVVAGTRHAAWIRGQTPRLPPDRLILEEVARNTTASIAMASLRICEREGDGIMIVTPADHWIGSGPKFRSTLRRAAEAAFRTDGLITIGVEPRTADTGFGYIRPGARSIVPGVRKAIAFVEKPEAAVARRMLRSGQYLWNCGIFVWKASVILRELLRIAPAGLRAARAWAKGATGGVWRVPRGVLERFAARPIDRTVLERSEGVFVVRAPFGWSDVGTWGAFGDLLKRVGAGNAALGRHLFLDASGCVAVNQDGISVVLGLRDVVVVRAGEDLLVCHRAAVQRVREIVHRVGPRFA